MLHAYLEMAMPGRGHRARAIRMLELAMDRLASEPLTPLLFGGVAGIAWVSQHLAEILHVGGVDDDFVDAFAEQALRHSLPWDFVTGLAGLGSFALDRPRGMATDGFIRALLDRLEQLAERTNDGGLRWHTPPEQLSPAMRAEHPNGCYDLGMAHGAAGVVAVLARVVRLAIDEPRASQLLERAVTWLTAQRAAGGGSLFRSIAGDERPARSAWCYGDPGIAVALLHAARVTQRQDWLHLAVETARHAARRPPDDTGVCDASICHGAAGLAHIFHRLYHETSDSELATAARDWLERTLALRRPGVAVGGYPRWRPRDRAFVADARLLTGATGIALVLLAAATPHAPLWDRMIALSL